MWRSNRIAPRPGISAAFLNPSKDARPRGAAVARWRLTVLPDAFPTVMAAMEVVRVPTAAMTTSFVAQTCPPPMPIRRTTRCDASAAVGSGGTRRKGGRDPTRNGKVAPGVTRVVRPVLCANGRHRCTSTSRERHRAWRNAVVFVRDPRRVGRPGHGTGAPSDHPRMDRNNDPYFEEKGGVPETPVATRPTRTEVESIPFDGRVEGDAGGILIGQTGTFEREGSLSRDGMGRETFPTSVHRRAPRWQHRPRTRCKKRCFRSRLRQRNLNRTTRPPEPLEEGRLRLHER